MSQPWRPTRTTATIASGGSLSGAISVAPEMPVAIEMPSSWTTAALTFQVSADGGATFKDFYDALGVEVRVEAAASRIICLDPALWAGVTDFKIRSGASGSTVNQGADRSIVVVSRRI